MSALTQPTFWKGLTMAENPFGDDAPQDEKQNYLVLISASKENASLAQLLLKNIQQHVDPRAAPLWIDSKGVGVFVHTELVAHEIWKAAIQSERVDLKDTRDLLVVELGSDWAARRDAKTEHWLSTHVGSPRIPPRRRRY
jgi:hypothetical protein